MQKVFSIFFFVFLMSLVINAQENKQDRVDITDFFSSTNHWYNITDELRAITPLPNQERYKPSEMRQIAENILLFQKVNGGWPKNYDMLAVLSKAQIDSLLEFKKVLNSTIDNGATYSHIKYLSEVFSITKEDKYKTACIKGIDYLLSAQYTNGGWPQFYPDTSGYRKYITFNDDAMTGVVSLFYKIVNHKNIYDYIGNERLKKVNAALENAIECILNTQIKENDTLSVWCQQHDNITLLPQWARTFEPPAICNMESTSIVKFLMSIDNPSQRIINAVESAVSWFNKSKISGFRYANVSSTTEEFMYHTANYDRILIPDSSASDLWPRFNELITHRPLFCNRDGKPVYSLSDVDKERRTGYAWYTDDPLEIFALYPEWVKENIK